MFFSVEKLEYWIKFDWCYVMRLTNVQRAGAICMLEAGTDQNVVARQFGVHKSTISRLSQKFRQTNSVNDPPRV